MRQSAVTAMIKKQYRLDSDDFIIRKLNFSEKKEETFEIITNDFKNKRLYSMEITIKTKGCLKKIFLKKEKLKINQKLM